MQPIRRSFGRAIRSRKQVGVTRGGLSQTWPTTDFYRTVENCNEREPAAWATPRLTLSVWLWPRAAKATRSTSTLREQAPLKNHLLTSLEQGRLNTRISTARFQSSLLTIEPGGSCVPSIGFRGYSASVAPPEDRNADQRKRQDRGLDPPERNVANHVSGDVGGRGNAVHQREKSRSRRIPATAGVWPRPAEPAHASRRGRGWQ